MSDMTARGDQRISF